MRENALRSNGERHYFVCLSFEENTGYGVLELDNWNPRDNGITKLLSRTNYSPVKAWPRTSAKTSQKRSVQVAIAGSELVFSCATGFDRGRSAITSSGKSLVGFSSLRPICSAIYGL